MFLFLTLVFLSVSLFDARLPVYLPNIMLVFLSVSLLSFCPFLYLTLVFLSVLLLSCCVFLYLMLVLLHVSLSALTRAPE